VSPAGLLEVNGISVEYRRRRARFEALQDVTLAVGKGETVGLVGESGSGKSTIARAILGLVPVKTGRVTFAGEHITAIPFKERRRVYRDLQVVFQDPYSSFNPARTIEQTLAEPLIAQGERDRKAIAARIAELLERVGLPPAVAGRLPNEFSGGQRQRIAIARALMVSPQLVICDEPVSALDLSVQGQIINLLQELQEQSGLSYLFISHDLELVRHFCDRVVVLYRGRVMESGEAERVAEAPAHPYTFALHQAAPVPDPRVQRHRDAATAAVDPDRAGATPAEGCPFAPRCPHAIGICERQRPELRPTEDGTGMTACHLYPEWRDRPGAPGVGAATGPGQADS
jgi:oligopeptide/dipeptide ABC transporter ATP-binding protein